MGQLGRNLFGRNSEWNGEGRPPIRYESVILSHEVRLNPWLISKWQNPANPGYFSANFPGILNILNNIWKNARDAYFPVNRRWRWFGITSCIKKTRSSRQSSNSALDDRWTLSSDHFCLHLFPSLAHHCRRGPRSLVQHFQMRVQRRAKNALKVFICVVRRC